MLTSLLVAAVIGFAAGYLSGQFGIGGGLVTTPAIRLILGRPELIAVGTPLPVIIPTAVAGAISYYRSGLVDLRVGMTVGLVGGALSIPAAWATSLVGGDVVLLVTALLICWMAIDMTVLAFRPERTAEQRAAHAERAGSVLWLLLLGVATGAYSGFLGLGGGFVVVPVLMRWFGFPAKRAFGTSLVAVSVLAVPGSITHYLLGHVDLALAAALTLGVVPGALLGARVTAAANEKTVRLGFAAMLLAVGAILGASELGLL
jgi:uncharacterized membrane protein YfcA